MGTFWLVFFFSALFAILVNNPASGHGAANNQQPAPGSGLLDSFKDKLLADTANGVFDWVFGDPNDAEANAHELEEHFGYLATETDSLNHLVASAGIKPEFLNFKAHDYDNNDKIDGLELMALILNEKVGGHQGGGGQQQQSTEEQMELGAKIIDRLLTEEDLNKDGFLDFNEYSNARARLTKST